VSRITTYDPRPGWGADVNADHLWADLAARQHGAFSRAQARALGMTSRVLRRRVVTGRLSEARSGVLVVSGHPGSWVQSLWVAHLWAGERSAISHRAAGALWEFEAVETGFVEITTTRRLRDEGVIVHRKRLSDRDVTRIDGLPVTTPGRTLLDLADVYREGRVARAMNTALHLGKTTIQELEGVLARCGGQGVRGTSLLRQLVEAHDSDDVVSQTTFERRLGHILRGAGLPRPVPQYEVIDEGSFVARPDFAYPEAKLAIEADSYRFHGSKEAWRTDLARRSRLARAGWRVLHVTWADVRDRPGAIVDLVRRALDLDRPKRSS